MNGNKYSFRVQNCSSLHVTPKTFAFLRIDGIEDEGHKEWALEYEWDEELHGSYYDLENINVTVVRFGSGVLARVVRAQAWDSMHVPPDLRPVFQRCVDNECEWVLLGPKQPELEGLDKPIDIYDERSTGPAATPDGGADL